MEPREFTVPPSLTVRGLDEALAGGFVTQALTNVVTEHPFHLSHLLRRAGDLAPPRTLHPVFYGSYDWHSCVHMHWTMVRCLGRFPRAPFAAAVRAHLDSRLAPDAIAGECSYFSSEGRTSFERPYGWGWLLKLHVELLARAAAASDDGRAERWAAAVGPLAVMIANRFVQWLPIAGYPVRAGTHGNSAFALQFALQWARATSHIELQCAVEEAARRWFGGDRRYPAEYEPSGDDFLSAGLCEALLMQRVLDAQEFSRWWQGFAPPKPALARWFESVLVSDDGDPKIVHLHGLNLSRAWCLRSLRRSLAATLHAELDQAVQSQLAFSLPAVTMGDFVGTHWLASFALLAIDDAV